VREERVPVALEQGGFGSASADDGQAAAAQ
jgi:hypothetical protein